MDKETYGRHGSSCQNNRSCLFDNVPKVLRGIEEHVLYFRLRLFLADSVEQTPLSGWICQHHEQIRDMRKHRHCDFLDSTSIIEFLLFLLLHRNIALDLPRQLAFLQIMHQLVEVNLINTFTLQ
jgi:hypothetical protein